MPDAGFSSSAGAKGGLVPLLLVSLTMLTAFIVFLLTVVLPNL
jgi:hypothetical protein